MKASDYFPAMRAVIVHLDDKNLPPARTASLCCIAERYFDNRYNNFGRSSVGLFLQRHCQIPAKTRDTDIPTKRKKGAPGYVLVELILCSKQFIPLHLVMSEMNKN
ncbi:MAG: hypothetical protein PVI06_14585 [Desulfobacterales bacterium]